jgi:hypothetical protein
MSNFLILCPKYCIVVLFTLLYHIFRIKTTLKIVGAPVALINNCNTAKIHPGSITIDCGYSTHSGSSLIKNKIKFSLYLWEFRVEQLQSHI